MDINELVSDLASDDQVKAYKAERRLNEETSSVGAAERESERKELATALAEAIAEGDPGHDKDSNPKRRPFREIAARNTLIRYLALVAGDDQVETLKRAMTDRDCREMARWALDRMTGDAATAALIEAAKTGMGNEFRVGVLNALAGRRGEGVAEALKKCVTDPSAQVRLAAAEALADHPDAEADSAIVRAGRRSGPRGQLRIAKARLRLAEALLNDGSHAAAKKICDDVQSAERTLPAQKQSAKILLQRTEKA